MKKGTQQQITAEMNSLARDVVGPQDPEVMRRVVLRLGGTPEEAEETARLIEQQNEKNGYGKAKAS